MRKDCPRSRTPGVDVYPYAQHHNPFVFLSDVLSPTQVTNRVPFSQFATDLASSQLPNFSHLLPDQRNNSHDGTLAQADAWLQQNIAPLIASPVFQKDGVLLIIFDESTFSDVTNGGGARDISARSRKAISRRLYANIPVRYASSCNHWEFRVFPGAAATAPDMNEFL